MNFTSLRHLAMKHKPQNVYVDVPVRSEKLEKAGTVNFKKHPARKVGTRSRQCGPKVPGRFALPGAPNPRICSISRFGKFFPAIFPNRSRSFPREPLNRPRKQPQPSRVSDDENLQKSAKICVWALFVPLGSSPSLRIFSGYFLGDNF